MPFAILLPHHEASPQHQLSSYPIKYNTELIMDKKIPLKQTNHPVPPNLTPTNQPTTYCRLGVWDRDRDFVLDLDRLALLLLLLLLLSFLMLCVGAERREKQGYTSEIFIISIK